MPSRQSSVYKYFGPEYSGPFTVLYDNGKSARFLNLRFGFDSQWDYLIFSYMPNNKVTADNFETVIDNLKVLYTNAEPEERSFYAGWLNQALNELLNDDVFGTEGQLDPRGDQRD